MGGPSSGLGRALGLAVRPRVSSVWLPISVACVALLAACGATGRATGPSSRAADPLEVPARHVASRAPLEARSASASRRGPRTINVSAPRGPCERIVLCCPHFLREIGEADSAPVACTLMQHFMRELHEDDDSCRDSLDEMRQTLALGHRPTPSACAPAP